MEHSKRVTILKNDVDVNQLRGLEIARSHLAQVKITCAKPAAVGVAIDEEITRRYARKGEDVVRNVQKNAIKSKKALANAAQRVAASLYPKSKTIPELDSIDPKFLLTLTGEELEDPSEKHLLWKSDNAAIFGSNYLTEALKTRVTELFADGT
uniref:Uncharacterized protein n=1 Tax=Panagrolaimus sp. JU765 TaxID=591449 RepID=A0AC34Q7N3_9BILA